MADRTPYFRCNVCGDNFGSEELLKEHFRFEHPNEEYSNPNRDRIQLNVSLSRLKKHLNTSFLLGFIAGILLTSLVFTGYNYVESSNTEQVTVTVLTCGNCSYERFRTVTDGIFDAEYREIAYNTEKGQEIIKKYDIRHVPGFIYSKNVEEARNFSHAEAQLVEFEDAYVLSDTGSEVAQRFSEGFELE